MTIIERDRNCGANKPAKANYFAISVGWKNSLNHFENQHRARINLSQMKMWHASTARKLSQFAGFCAIEIL